MKNLKIISAGILAMILLCGCSMMKPKSIEISLEPGQSLKSGQNIIINVESKPGSIKVDPNSITVSGGESWVDGGTVKFKAMKPGDYTMVINQDSVESNTLTIPVGEADLYVATDSGTTSEESLQASSEESQTPSSQQSQASSEEEDPLADAKKTVQEQKRTVDEVYAKQDELVDSDQLITVDGLLPQTVIQDKSGKDVQVLWDPDLKQYLILSGFKIPFGGCEAQATGRLTRNENGELVLNMTYISY